MSGSFPTVGIDPNTFEVLNGHPTKIPTYKILGGVIQNTPIAPIAPTFAAQHLCNNMHIWLWSSGSSGDDVAPTKPSCCSRSLDGEYELQSFSHDGDGDGCEEDDDATM